MIELERSHLFVLAVITEDILSHRLSFLSGSIIWNPQGITTLSNQKTIEITMEAKGLTHKHHWHFLGPTEEPIFNKLIESNMELNPSYILKA